MSDTIDKVSIIISRGSLEGVYPGLIMANGARMEGIDANLFFTFFGLDAIHKRQARPRQGRHRRRARPAPRHLAGRPPRHVLAGHAPAGQQDGGARHPADPRVRRDDLRLRRRPLRLQGIGRPVRTRQATTSSTRSTTSSPSASSTSSPPAARSSSPDADPRHPNADPRHVEGRRYTHCGGRWVRCREFDGETP